MKKLIQVSFSILAASLSVAYADNAVSMVQMQQQLQTLQASRDQLQTIISQNLNQLAKINANITSLQNNMRQAQAATHSDGINWVQNAGQALPKNAFIAAQNGNQNIYICQANYSQNQYQEGTYPGVLQNDSCVITYAGNAYNQQSYAILASTKPLYWIDSSKVSNLFASTNNNPPWINLMVMPSNSASPQQAVPQPTLSPAIVGGSEGAHSIYICRANIGGTWYLGKLISNNNCMLAINGKEASWPVYQVLMSKDLAS